MRWVCTFIVYTGRWSNLNILSSPKFQIFLRSKLYSSRHRWLQFSKAQRLRCPDRSGHLLMSATSILPAYRKSSIWRTVHVHCSNYSWQSFQIFHPFIHVSVFRSTPNPPDTRHLIPDRDRSRHFKFQVRGLYEGSTIFDLHLETIQCVVQKLRL